MNLVEGERHPRREILRRNGTAVVNITLRRIRAEIFIHEIGLLPSPAEVKHPRHTATITLQLVLHLIDMIYNFIVEKICKTFVHDLESNSRCYLVSAAQIQAGLDLHGARPQCCMHEHFLHPLDCAVVSVADNIRTAVHLNFKLRGNNLLESNITFNCSKFKFHCFKLVQYPAGQFLVALPVVETFVRSIAIPPPLKPEGCVTLDSRRNRNENRCCTSCVHGGRRETKFQTLVRLRLTDCKYSCRWNGEFSHYTWYDQQQQYPTCNRTNNL